MTSKISIPDTLEVSRRLDQFFQLYALNMRLAEAGVKLDHPDATPKEVQQQLADRLRIVREEKWKGHGPSDSQHR